LNALFTQPHSSPNQALLEGLLKRHKRDIAFAALGGILVASAWLLWPVLFSMRLDGTTSMSWSTVWIPLWIATFIGECARAKGADAAGRQQ